MLHAKTMSVRRLEECEKNIGKERGESAEGKMEKDRFQYSSSLGSLDDSIYLGYKTVCLICLTVAGPKTLSLRYVTSEFSGVQWKKVTKVCMDCCTLKFSSIIYYNPQSSL